jgi:hypothetical protein
MPIEIVTVTQNQSYGNPFIGDVGQVEHIKLDVSVLTTDEVDSNGYLKPGVLLKSTGVLPDGTASEYIWGATPEAYKLPGRTGNSSLGSDTTDPLVPVVRDCLINRDIWEDNMGRAMTAYELAAIARAGSHVKITTT